MFNINNINQSEILTAAHSEELFKNKKPLLFPFYEREGGVNFIIFYLYATVISFVK